MSLTPYDGFTERDWETDVSGTIRLAIVGLGWYGRDVALPATTDAEYVETTVVVSSSLEKAEQVRDEHDVVERALTYEDFHDGEAADAYDAVYIVTPNALHLPYAETAADLDKDVLCEKPLEATAERASALVDVCSEEGVTLMTAYRMHFEPVTRRVRELVEEGFVGDVVQVDGSFAGPLIHRGEPGQWRFDPDLAGGGALFDIGIYPLNTTRFVLGADPVAVQSAVVPEEKILDGLDVHTSFQLEFPDDVVASCRTSYDAYGDNYLVVLGTDGRIEVESAFGGDEITLRAEREGIETEVSLDTDELVEEFAYFGNKLLAGEPVEPDGEHGLSDLRTMEAVYEADERGERVDL